MLGRFGQIFEHVDANHTDDEQLMEDEHESVDLLRVGAMEDVVQQEQEGHGGQDVERVLLGVVDGQHEDERGLVDEVDWRVELLHQHGEDERARETPVQDHSADHGGDDGNGDDAPQNVELLRHDAVAALHAGHLQHEREHDQKHAHECSHEQHSLEDEVVHLVGSRPLALVLGLLLLRERLDNLVFVVLLFDFEEQAHHDHCHQDDVHHVVGQKELLFQSDRGQTECEGVGSRVVDALGLVVSRGVPQHLQGRKRGRSCLHDGLSVQHSLNGLDHFDADHSLGDASCEHDNNGNHVQHNHDDFQWFVDCVVLIIGEFGIHSRGWNRN